MRLLVLSSLLAMLCSATALQAADKPQSEKEIGTLLLRKFATNVQYNKDGTVRLVRLSKPHVTDEALQTVKQFSKIDYLAVVAPKVTDAGIANIAPLTNLDTLLLSDTQLTDAGLAYLKGLKNLERLYLDDSQITDAGLAHLQGLDKLQTLSLERTKITSSGLAHLSGLKNLEILLLNRTQVDDKGLAHLAKLAKLKVLYLTGCTIRGSGLTHLKGLKKLEQLGLTDTKVGEDLAKSLSVLSGLKNVEIYRTQLDEKTIAAVRKALPKTRLYGLAKTKAGVASKTATKSKENKPIVASKEVLKSIQQRLAEKEKVVPDFQRHTVALLGRLGCNGRACHGSFQGKGGFRLSMFGYDFDLDHKNLIERINLKSPGESLVLNKPTSEDEHEGGLRLPAGGWEQQLLRRWIEEGAKNIAPDADTFVRLEVTPAELVFQKEGETAQLRAVAVWSDGTREDVTCLTRFESKDDSVADVTPEGLIRARGKGDTYVISYYDNGIFSTQVILPVSDQTGPRYAPVPTPTKIDELVVAKLRKLGVRPSALSGDEEFLRRVCLDIVGTLPTPEEIRTFVADKSADKRANKIDELLERPAYVTWWTTRLCDLTGSNAGYLGGTEMAQPVAAQWRAWIERRVRDNDGWDKIVEGIILASSRRPGQTYREFIAEQSTYTRRGEPADFSAPGNSMPHFWFRSNISQPKDKALAFGYSFLGVRLDCAQCHKHPFDQWSQQDFEQFTQFFTRIKAGVSPEAAVLHEKTRNMLAVPVKLNTAALRRQSYLRIASEGRPIPWKEVFIEPPTGDNPVLAKLLGGRTYDLNQQEDPRVLLMNWLRSDPNRLFAKAFVNRIWANYFNVGIIEPPDDLNQANPPSNKALLDYLVEGFIASGYDMKWLHRTIASSRTYQLSWRPNDTNRMDQRNFSHAILRRLPAEVAVDALIQAAASDAKLALVKADVKNRKIGQHPKSFQARSIDFSLLVFGKPLRTTNCDCERQKEATLLQALYVRNDQEMLAMLEDPNGWLGQLTKAKPKAEQVDDLIAQAYLRTLSRLPSESELTDLRRHVQESENIVEGLRDLMWALLNTQEFITNH